MISVCQKCLRIKVNDSAPWSPRPSPQINVKKGGFITVEECDYCDGTIQEEPGTVSGPERRSEVPKKVDPTPKKENTENGKGSAKVEEALKKPRGRPKKSQTTKESNEERKEVHTVPAAETKVKEVQKTLDIAKLDERQAPIADKHHRALVECKKLMGKSLLEFCYHLREIKEKEYYKFYADGWYEYLSTPEIALDVTRATRLIELLDVKEAMERQLKRNLNLEEIAESRLTRDLLPCVDYDKKTKEIKNPQKVEELLDQARTLGHEDWQAEVAKAKPRVGGKKAKETRIATGPLKNGKGDIIGQVVSVRANDENHYVSLRIDNSWIPDGPLVLKIE